MALEITLIASPSSMVTSTVGAMKSYSDVGVVTGPVLDIGALAHALFPSWWDLSLEGLAHLVEVQPIGRHTAEGDALTAGLIFVRLVPLLEQRGVTTLSDALAVQRRGPIVPAGPGATGGGLAGP